MEHFDFEQLHIRPRFKFTVPYETIALVAHLKKKFKSKDHKFPTSVVGNYFTLDVPQHIAHFWSPRVSFEIEVNEEDPSKSTVRGLIGPKPNVWTMFVFIYFAIGILGVFASIYGLSKSTLGQSSLMVWGFPIALLAMSTAYVASKSGEKLGAEQIEILKTFFRDSWKELQQ
ncbi:MAG: hypothetical protein DWP98_01320 [Bacteroidetes bacterium]|nr:MAG: hypothetical protein DWP98_01320 [Bacteroidota bacterium]MBL1144419.1 hypothetical protein [Bacteroidota bacterium]MCB0803568.1 hypothetical protein [Flavobacteriales bacterium]NOG57213.1 hypothetical protein [Bacteroidota bacterium]